MTDAADPPVRTIGRYRVGAVVGTGAFATVYRAVDERLDATVAIKLLADNHCLDPDIRARFIAEGRALRRVDSPHVLRVYDVGETEQLQPYLVVEHADRGSLAQRVDELRASGWRPGAADLGVLVDDLAEAVEAVHAANLVHRDLSPGNVLLRSTHDPAGGRPETPLVRRDERLVVADLGLAKDLRRSSGLTVAGGTDGFRPPEQRTGPGRIDERADLWALSALVHWLLTEAAPDTDGRADPAARAARLDDAVRRLGLPTALRDPVLAGLADDPGERPADVATWRTAMRAALVPPAPVAPPSARPPDPSSPPRPPAPGPPSAGRNARRRRVGRAAALVAAGALVGGAVIAVVGGDDDGDGSGTTTRRDDGMVEVADTAGDARLAVVGPAEAGVGTTVTFEAEADGLDEWAWLMPDGTVYANAPDVELRTQSAGEAEITLVGTTADGERLEVVHTLEVADA